MTNRLPDVIAKELDVLFAGINPGLAAAAAGHHFVGKNNRFWTALHLAGFTPVEISPEHDRLLLEYGCGITSVVSRATKGADELASHEFAAATEEFERKIVHYKPRFVAFLGKAAYAGMKGQRLIDWGLQPDRICGATVWVLPNPSGRNRSFPLDRLVGAYRHLYLEAFITPELDNSEMKNPVER